MKKIARAIATVALLCSVCFLGGEWPEDTPRRKVITYDSCAFATMLACGLYLNKAMKEEEK